jgi:prepilin-type N-terminal cleavage/methylation domain-containing protein
MRRNIDSSQFEAIAGPVSCLGQAKREDAFSLVELLVVITVIALLTSLTVPALSALKNAGGVNQAVNGISLSPDEARAYAMAHNTYVWVGFVQPTGSQNLLVGMVAGTAGGSSSINVSSAPPTSYVPIATVQSYPNLSLATVSAVESSNSDTSWTSLMPVGTELSSSSLTGFTQSSGGTTLSFPQGSILQFSPQGEANVSSTGALQHWIQFGLQPVRGGRSNGPDVAIIQISGLNGRVQVFRP